MRALKLLRNLQLKIDAKYMTVELIYWQTDPWFETSF